jgi:hypothetical protein
MLQQIIDELRRCGYRLRKVIKNGLEYYLIYYYHSCRGRILVSSGGADRLIIRSYDGREIELNESLFLKMGIIKIFDSIKLYKV